MPKKNEYVAGISSLKKIDRLLQHCLIKVDWVMLNELENFEEIKVKKSSLLYFLKITFIFLIIKLLFISKKKSF